MDLSLANKKAVVCGSTQGIGRASALQLSSQGASLLLVARNEDSLKSVLAECDQSNGQQHSYLVADFTNPMQLGEAIQNECSTSGPYHVLINNTGGPAPGLTIEAEPEAFLQAMEMHIVCNQILAKCLVPGMKESGYGRIININSTSVREPIANLGVSNTTRAAVAAWAKSLSKELGQFGITVNNVLPGFTATHRLEKLIFGRSSKQGISEDAVAKAMKSTVPLARFAQAEEVANAVGFLSSPAAAYISGVSLPVDGGRISSI